MKYRYVASMLAVMMASSIAGATLAAAAEETGEAAAAEVSAETIEETAEAEDEMEQLPEEAEDSAVVAESAVSEVKASAGSEKNATAKKKGAEKEKVETDADGLIEDDGTVTSVHTGSSIEELLEAEGGFAFPGFEVDPWKYPPVNVTENTQVIYWYLRDELKLNHAAACGVLANIQMEANFRPIALGDGGTSYGICQWHLGRFSRLMDFCRKKELDYNTLEGQLAYLKYELENYFPQVLGILKDTEDTSKGAYAAAYYFCYHFEIPDQTVARSQQRGNLAQYEYYPEKIEKLDEEESLIILREVFEEKEEDTGSDELEELTAAGMILPEDFQVNLFLSGTETVVEADAAADETEEAEETADAAEETEEETVTEE